MGSSISRTSYSSVASSENDEIETSCCSHCGGSVKLQGGGRFWPTLSTGWFLRSASLILISNLITLATVAAFASLYFNSLSTRICSHNTYIGISSPIGKQRDYFPPFSLVTKTYFSEQDYLDSGEIGAKAWEEYIPHGLGFVTVTDPRKYALPSSMPLQYLNDAIRRNHGEDIPTDNNTDEAYSEVYGTTVTHQQHCLLALRHSVVDYIHGEPFQNNDLYESKHLLHCLGFLRWTTMCAADITLSAAIPYWNHTSKSTRYKYTGKGTVHQCRDWNTVASFLDERQPELTKIKEVDSPVVKLYSP